MEKVILEPDNKNMFFIEKNEDRSCEIKVKDRGVFKGHIDSIYSSGRYIITLLEKIEDR